MADLMKTPTYLGTWTTPEPKSGDPTFNLFAAFNGAGIALETFAAESRAVLGANDLQDFVPEARQRIIEERLQAAQGKVFAKLAPYNGILAAAAKTITELENNLSGGKPAGISEATRSTTAATAPGHHGHAYGHYKNHDHDNGYRKDYGNESGYGNGPGNGDGQGNGHHNGHGND